MGNNFITFNLPESGQVGTVEGGGDKKTKQTQNKVGGESTTEAIGLHYTFSFLGTRKQRSWQGWNAGKWQEGGDWWSYNGASFKTDWEQQGGRESSVDSLPI